MQMLALVVILWMGSKLLLVGTLVLLHLGWQRRSSVPAPLLERQTRVSAATRLREGAFGLTAIYALCVAASFVSSFGQPTGSSLVLRPVAGSPAVRAGLMEGDRARSVAGVSVKSFDEFRQAVAGAPESVSIEVERKGQVLSLLLRKDADNRIGVETVPTETVGAIAALSAAVRAPAVFVSGWIRGVVGAFSETVEVAGPVAIGAAVSSGGARWIQALALLLSKDLPIVAIVYVVVLVADTRSRAGQPAAQKPAAQG